MTKQERIDKYGIEAWERMRLADKTRKLLLKEEISTYYKKYYQDNKDKKINQVKEYRDNNKELINSKKKEKYNSNHFYKAGCLINSYEKSDKVFNRGECTITNEWVIENIFASKCIYCGDSNWQHLGCDRIDNSKPHTPDNVVCSCGVCNVERKNRKLNIEEFIEYRKEHPRACDIKKEPSINDKGLLIKKSVK